MIRWLNPVIRGWANYHRHIVAKRTFRKVERVIWQCLWRWARRRHPGKPTGWIVRKYWHRLDGLKVFAADSGERTADGKIIWLKLVNPTRNPIRRHVKVRMDANPFDPHWRDYFEDRAFFKRMGIHRKEAGLNG